MAALLTLSSASAHAGPPKTPLRNFLEDGKYVFSLPFRKEHRKTTLLLTSAFAMSSLADRPVQKHLYPDRKKETPDEFRTTGDMLQFAGLAYGTVLGLRGVIADDADDRLEGVLAYETYLWSAAALGGLKWVAGRRRPAESGNPFRFIFREHGSSFPSGHTTQAFAAATLISEHYDNMAITVPAYGLAVSVGVSRALANKHWVSDVVVGAALGTFIAHALRLRYEGRRSEEKAWRLEPSDDGLRVVREF